MPNYMMVDGVDREYDGGTVCIDGVNREIDSGLVCIDGVNRELDIGEILLSELPLGTLVKITDVNGYTQNFKVQDNYDGTALYLVPLTYLDGFTVPYGLEVEQAYTGLSSADYDSSTIYQYVLGQSLTLNTTYSDLVRYSTDGIAIPWGLYVKSTFVFDVSGSSSPYWRFSQWYINVNGKYSTTYVDNDDISAGIPSALEKTIAWAIPIDGINIMVSGSQNTDGSYTYIGIAE